MISRMLMFTLLLGGASACDPAGPSVRSASRASAEVASEAGAPARSGPRAAPRRGRMIGGERVERAPQWPPASQIDQALRGRAPATLLAAVARSPVPVLVPADPSWLARAGLYVPDDPQAFGYTFSSTTRDARGERHLSVMASRFATLLPHVARFRGSAVRSGQGFFSLNEGVRTASWIEHGVAYSLDLECFDPEACDEGALRELVAGLVYVGGAAGGAP